MSSIKTIFVFVWGVLHSFLYGFHITVLNGVQDVVICPTDSADSPSRFGLLGCLDLTVSQSETKWLADRIGCAIRSHRLATHLGWAGRLAQCRSLHSQAGPYRNTQAWGAGHTGRNRSGWTRQLHVAYGRWPVRSEHEPSGRAAKYPQFDHRLRLRLDSGFCPASPERNLEPQAFDHGGIITPDLHRYRHARLAKLVDPFFEAAPLAT